MGELQQQLAILRQRIARIDEKFAAPRPLLESPRAPFGAHLETVLTGEEVETGFGRHFETEKLYEHHRYHGSADIGALADLPIDLLETISGGLVSNIPPEEWAFLDTETTGLAGGTGTYAFLAGVGRITREGFRVRQFFMRECGEEASQLDALARHLEPFRVLITYNGRAFDQPLLETRYRMNRARAPFARMQHLDLLFGARRLWKLRFESCRLVDLENQVLGFEREGDLPHLSLHLLAAARHLRLCTQCHINRIKMAPMVAATKVRMKPNTWIFRRLASNPPTKDPAMPTKILVKML